MAVMNGTLISYTPFLTWQCHESRGEGIPALLQCCLPSTSFIHILQTPTNHQLNKLNQSHNAVLYQPPCEQQNHTTHHRLEANTSPAQRLESSFQTDKAEHRTGQTTTNIFTFHHSHPSTCFLLQQSQMHSQLNLSLSLPHQVTEEDSLLPHP